MKKWLVGLLIVGFLFVPAISFAFTVALAWEASPSPDVSEYIINWGIEPGIYLASASVGNNLTGQVTNLANGEMYYFAVSCRDIEGRESGFSNEVFTDGINVIPDGNPPLSPGGCYVVTITP